MPSLLVHATCGPDDPTKAALAGFVAAAAIAAGHDVTLFLAGDAVQLVRPAVRESLVGLGTGRFGEHFEAFIAGGGALVVSKASCAARGVTEADLDDLDHEKGTPARLVELVITCDRSIVY